MDKAFVKKCLCILDFMETKGIEAHKLASSLRKELLKEGVPFEEPLLQSLVSYLQTYGFLKDTGRGFDLIASAAVFAKAEANSRLEALALFECLYRNDSYRHILQHCLYHRITKSYLSEHLDPISLAVALQTSLFLPKQDCYTVHDECRDDIITIIDEYAANDALLISVTLCTIYTGNLLDLNDDALEYKNKDAQMAAYPRSNIILKNIPHRGVPCDRDATRMLQSFYKDTLFHECNQVCVLCRIDLPHMLIASHIKPFRDCAHIYEAVDHNNGLLLCRNHDFLFDQGYVSFDNSGRLLISTVLQEKLAVDEGSYQLKDGFCLDAALLSEERKLFLSYHRKNIFIADSYD